jgi:hypothetical protein
VMDANTRADPAVATASAQFAGETALAHWV